MSQSGPSGADQNPEAWDSDPSDGREKGQWKTAYADKEARNGIRWESFYLVLWFIVYLGGVFYILHLACGSGLAGDSPSDSEAKKTENALMFLGFVGAWAAGCLGGFVYAIKWMYHVVARRMWHEDRRLWRFLAPHLSGVVSLFMVLLVSSGLLALFDKDFTRRPESVMAFSFLVGLFSDKALAKMAEVADTLFGGKKKEK